MRREVLICGKALKSHDKITLLSTLDPIAKQGENSALPSCKMELNLFPKGPVARENNTYSLRGRTQVSDCIFRPIFRKSLRRCEQVKEQCKIGLK